MVTHPSSGPPCLVRSVGSGPPLALVPLRWKDPGRERRWFGKTALGPFPARPCLLAQELYLQSQCNCCSYHLDPESPVWILNLSWWPHGVSGAAGHPQLPMPGWVWAPGGRGADISTQAPQPLVGFVVLECFRFTPLPFSACLSSFSPITLSVGIWSR